MSYLDPHTHLQEKLASVTGVAVIHLVLAVGLAAGLTIKAIKPDAQRPLVGTNIDLPPPPDDPLPPEAPRTEQGSPPITAPRPLIALPNPSPVEAVDTIPFPIDVVRVPAPPIAEPIPNAVPTPPGLSRRAALPRNGPAGWVTTDDYPRRAIVAEWQGTADYLLDVGQDGKVANCRITRSSGYALLDETTCRMITRRARFEAARDESGARVAGSYRGTITWQLPD